MQYVTRSVNNTFRPYFPGKISFFFFLQVTWIQLSPECLGDTWQSKIAENWSSPRKILREQFTQLSLLCLLFPRKCHPQRSSSSVSHVRLDSRGLKRERTFSFRTSWRDEKRRGSKSISPLNGPFFPPATIAGNTTPSDCSYSSRYTLAFMIFRTIAGDWGDSEMEQPHHRRRLSPRRLPLLSQPSCWGSRRRCGDGISISISREGIMRYYRRHTGYGGGSETMVCPYHRSVPR